MAAANPVIAALGRRLRLAVIGGGGAALIGPVHRAAARLDDRIEIKAAVLSSDPQRSRDQARELLIERAYGDLPALIKGERARHDGIDAIAIMTPNDSHVRLAMAAIAAGFDVICDKPLANDSGDAAALADAVAESGLVFALTHNYSGYPMIRQARAMVGDGTLGRLHLAHVSYAQGTLAQRVEDGDIPNRLRWRLSQEQGGPSHVMGDIGTHAHQLLSFVSHRRVEAVMADLGAQVEGRAAHDTAQALLRLEGGLKASLWVTKVAHGAENELRLELYGDRGGLRWSHASANHLEWVRLGEPAQMLSRGNAYLAAAARRAGRLPPGHPEGFHEGFANIYADFAECVAARIAGTSADPLARDIPTCADGLAGLDLIDAALQSSRERRWVEVRRR